MIRANSSTNRFQVTENSGVVVNPRSDSDAAGNASSIRIYDPNNNRTSNAFQGSIDWVGADGNRGMYIGQESSGNQNMIVLNDVSSTANNLILQQGSGSIYLNGQTRLRRGDHSPGFTINTGNSSAIRWSTGAILRRDTPLVNTIGGYHKDSFNDSGGNVTIQGGHGSSGNGRQFTASFTINSGRGFIYCYSERLQEWFVI